MKTRWQNPFDYFDSIYFINLPERVDRFNQSDLEFRKMGIKDIFFVEGVKHANPATGCHLAHSKCFSHALQEGFDRILIFEDDIEFFDDAYENMQLVLNELPPNWDMFYLGGNLDRYAAYEISEHIARIEGIFSTHAYAIRRNLFRTLYTVNADETTIHNDVYYANYIHPNYECYLALPLIAGQRDSYSDIQKRVMSSNKVFQERLASNLHKRVK